MRNLLAVMVLICCSDISLAAEFCASVMRDVNTGVKENIRINIAKPNLGSAEVDGRVCLDDISQPCSLVHGEAAPYFSDVDDGKQARTQSTQRQDGTVIDMEVMGSSYDMYVPEFCIPESPRFNATQCQQLLAGAFPNADFSDFSESDTIQNIKVSESLYLPSDANEGEVITKISLQTTENTRSYLKAGKFYVESCRRKTKAEAIRDKDFASELNRITNFK